ncbi:VanZ family protein [Hydrogenophaga sp. BPS33]|nr:VanZ family protein [Hydrogenophaga sp. BPS33]
MKTRSSAWPLALLFAGLVVYASLYPFAGWRVQGVSPLAFLQAPLPEYWTGFDVASNLLGYAPLGFLLSMAMLRSGLGRWSWWLAFALPALLSLSVETLQNYLPMRVPSNVDFALNTAGAAVGGTFAWAMERVGILRRWSAFRSSWFEPTAHGSLVLLALWPLALLYPLPVPFGLGQVLDRVESGLISSLDDTPFLAWLPLRVETPDPLSPLAEAFCVALCLLSPILLGFAEMRSVFRRGAFMLVLLVCALVAAGLSAALTYGPSHAWAWITPQVALGMGIALMAGLGMLGLPRRLCTVVMLLTLSVSLTLLNQAPDSPYFVQSLEAWEQGRFIRFHGLSQWLGWLWPFAALVFGLRAVARTPGLTTKIPP